MTMPSERFRALRFAEELMRDILSRDKYPDLPDALRMEAKIVLRHYPDASTREEMLRNDEAAQAGSFIQPLLSRE